LSAVVVNVEDVLSSGRRWPLAGRRLSPPGSAGCILIDTNGEYVQAVYFFDCGLSRTRPDSLRVTVI